MSMYFEEKLAQFERALATLKKAMLPDPSDLEIDGAIQRFEYCFELAWKSLKLQLEQTGVSGISSPKAAIQKGFITGIVADEDEWLKILDDRNLSVLTYDEKTAREIFQRLPGICRRSGRC
jgi:nucleotidyltransferase substrate binding protein (TIGR01987 family)